MKVSKRGRREHVSTERIEQLDRMIDSIRMKRKDSDAVKVENEVLDTQTLMGLYRLARKGKFDALGGVINAGKEANIFLARKGDVSIAVKIYMITTSNFNTMKKYVLGDRRFAGVKQDRQHIIFAWAQKEYRNLQSAKKAGVRVPEPYAFHRNILLMEFIGRDGLPFPQLKDVPLTKEEAEHVVERLLEYISLLYQRVHMVHGDMSEYNVLLDPDTFEPVVIDMGQSVLLDHPLAEEMLVRDIANIVRLAREHGLFYDVDTCIQNVKEVGV